MAKRGRLFTNVLAIAGIWLFLSGISLLTLWPSIPSSSSGWLLLVVLGPPLYLAGEYLADRMWSSEPGKAISEHPSRTFRIAAGVVFGLMFLIALLVASHFLSSK